MHLLYGWRRRAAGTVAVAMVIAGAGIAAGVAAAGAVPAGAVPAGVAAASAAAASEPALTWPRCVPRRAPVRLGIAEVGRTRHGRLITLMLRSRAMADVQPVDVLLPAHFDSSGRTRYHVLYLLHGAGGDYRTWVGIGVQRLLGNLPVITVMPSGSTPQMDGNYTDWQAMAPGPGAQAPAWESYHIRELLPFIDAHFPTIRTAAGRAIAGISMGGGGATKYAAEYPGTFGYVGTFSGESHPLLPVALAFQPKTCRWGDPATEQVIWRDNDSADLASNLHGVRIFIRTGNGVPGPYDSSSPPADPGAAFLRQVHLVVEFGAQLENEALLDGLRAAGVGDVDARFFAGSHTLPYWVRDMREFVPWLRRQFARPPQAPAWFTVESAHPWFTAWGWTFQVQRRVREFIYARVAPGRLDVIGSGKLQVLSPPRFRAGSAYVLRVGAARRQLRADRLGRLAFTVGLGPSHTRRQTRFDASATRSWPHLTVRITPATR